MIGAGLAAFALGVLIALAALLELGGTDLVWGTVLVAVALDAGVVELVADLAVGAGAILEAAGAGVGGGVAAAAATLGVVGALDTGEGAVDVDAVGSALAAG